MNALRTVLVNLKKDKMLQIMIPIVIVLSAIKLPDWHEIDFQTIMSLLCLLLFVKLLERKNLLSFIANKLLNYLRTERQLTVLFMTLSFFSSMFLTNDVAILTIIPIFLLVTEAISGKQLYSLILITIAANLGSAVTPFGNPQNLFLYSHFSLKTVDFFQVSLVLGVLSYVLLFCLCFFVPSSPLQVKVNRSYDYPVSGIGKLIILSIVVFLGLLSVIPLWISLLPVFVYTYRNDATVFVQIDYGLLITFVCFFLAVSSLKNIELITESVPVFFNSAQSIFIGGIVFSQFLSNVPTAILLSGFTENFPALFLGTNIGGLGTLISSLANIIAFRQLIKVKPSLGKSFLLGFTCINFAVLFFLTIVFSFYLNLYS